MMKLRTTPRFGLFLLAACLMLACVYAQAVVDHELKGLGEQVGAWVDGVYDSFVDNVNGAKDSFVDNVSYNVHSLVDSTVKPEHGATTLNSRSHSSYYCEWDWWSNKIWLGLTQVKSGKAKTFDKCAMMCCKNPYCATFGWNKRRKRCYQYNQNIGTDNLVYDDAPGWKMGALTYKNGYSYV